MSLLNSLTTSIHSDTIILPIDSFTLPTYALFFHRTAGCLYFLAWSLPLYAQIVRQFRFNTGVNWDALFNRLIVFTCYTIFLTITRHEHSSLDLPSSVDTTDLIYAYQTLFLTIVSFVASAKTETHTSLSASHLYIACVTISIAVYNLFLALYDIVPFSSTTEIFSTAIYFQQFPWAFPPLSALTFLTFLIIVHSILSALPHLIRHVRRHSVYPSSMISILLSLFGAIFSLVQQYIASIYFSPSLPSPFITNFAKTGLAITLLILALVLALQRCKYGRGTEGYETIGYNESEWWHPQSSSLNGNKYAHHYNDEYSALLNGSRRQQLSDSSVENSNIF